MWHSTLVYLFGFVFKRHENWWKHENMYNVWKDRQWVVYNLLCKVVGYIISTRHYNDVIMSSMASQISSLTIVYSTVCSDADQRKHQSSASLAFVRGIPRGPVNSPHKWPVTRKMFLFDDVIMDFKMWCSAIALCWCWFAAANIAHLSGCITHSCRAHHQGWHYNDVIISTTASQITGLTIVYSTVYPGPDER